ncbi:ribose-phosphate diphosphokinase [Candidatus Bathyarchaeota archaeon]|nr:ribose-phosphate diphosphokinase [Candidatus Bathyarchaeota archaeon]
MMLLSGPASRELGERIANAAGIVNKPVEHRLFPDGESFIRILANVKNEHIIIVQTTAPLPDQKLMQLLVMSKTVKDYGAKQITAVVPYLSYSRQDKRFQEGEALTLDVVFGLLESTGVNNLIICDSHNPTSIKKIEENHTLKIHELSITPLLAEYYRSKGYENAFSLSPDKGAVRLAKAASEILNGGYGAFEKVRDIKTGLTTMEIKDLNVIGKKAIVFDDIISTGGTMAQAVAGLKNQGAKSVAVACTHALFMGGAEEKILRAGAESILASDCIETPYSKVTIADLVAKKILEIS